MNNTTASNLKSYLDELDYLLKRQNELLESQDDEYALREVARLINCIKVTLAKQVLDL